MIFWSAIEPIYYILPLAGFLIGLFGSVIGGGGGFFFLPLLTLVVGVPPQTAVITSLVATLPVCAVATSGHYRQGNIDTRKGVTFAMTGIIGAFAGAAIANVISAGQLKAAFGIYAILISLNMARSTRQRKLSTAIVPDADKIKKLNLLNKTKGPFFGFFAGTITGTFGTSGTAPIMAGLFSMNMPVKIVVGTSLMVALVNTFFAVSAHFLVGRIDLTVVLFLTAGSALGAIPGPGILNKMKTDNSENRIRYIFALIMTLTGILMIIT